MSWFDIYPLTDGQIEDIRQAVAEADAGLFAAEEEVEAMYLRIAGPFTTGKESIESEPKA